MKKSLSILCTVLLLALLAACGTTNTTPASEPMLTAAPAEENPSKETELPETGPTSSTPKFDLETGTVILNNGISMPILGIGTFSLSDSEAEEDQASCPFPEQTYSCVFSFPPSYNFLCKKCSHVFLVMATFYRTLNMF